jgi:hypothetical protein
MENLPCGIPFEESAQASERIKNRRGNSNPRVSKRFDEEDWI